MSIYDILEEAQAPTNFKKSPEQIYYDENRYRLNELESYSYLADSSDSFGIVRGNIILRALENKESIEKLFKKYEKNYFSPAISLNEYMENGLLGLPYLVFKGEKNYVPIFALSISMIYSKNFSRLGEMPYKKIFKQYEAALIDPFDYYGYEIFISYFTRLVLIDKTPDCAAFYDYDAKTIYFVNDEGRLDAKVCLFDKDLKHPLLNHLMPRIKTVVDAYFSNNKEMLVQTLFDNGLISETLFEKIKKSWSKRQRG